MASQPDPTGTLATALAHCARLLGPAPDKALEQARAILDAVPNQPTARFFLGIAQRRTGDVAASLATLRGVARDNPASADVAHEFGLTLAEAGRGEEARAAFAAATRINPNHAEAWRALGDQHRLAGDEAAADAAYALQIRASVSEPRLIEAANALNEGKLAIAERLLKAFLAEKPTDAPAIRMLAEVAARIGRNEDAVALLQRCLELAPGFVPARANLATVLHRANRFPEALAEVDALLARDPRNPGYRNLRAAILARTGALDEAAELYGAVLADYPRQPKVWMSYGHTLKTIGRLAPSIEAYRTALEQAPQLGEVWWSLANLKTVRFSLEDVATMRAQLERTDLDPEDRFHLHFALGKALEDAGDYGPAFDHYAQGNALRRESLPYDADAMDAAMTRARRFFTREYFAVRAGDGDPAPDPIFIVGLPRAGSTLIEQILASHSQVEGTAELPDMPAIAARLAGRGDGEHYPGVLAELSADEIAALGRSYLETSRIQRRTDKPFFIDKLPNNFLHTGLIATILPGAKIIDARRHPMGCCFSAFKQHFASGQGFSYDLADLGRYYRGYVRLMAHFDEVLPGRVHRVIYEEMVADSEAEIRRLLAYCGLAFEPACLAFHETERAVRTPSSEQVRQPIFTAGVDQWQHFAPWLAPLASALGPVLDSYPAVPLDE